MFMFEAREAGLEEGGGSGVGAGGAALGRAANMGPCRPDVLSRAARLVHDPSMSNVATWSPRQGALRFVIRSVDETQDMLWMVLDGVRAETWTNEQPTRVG